MGSFFPRELVKLARRNVRRHAWALEARDRMVERARPWLEMTEQELWELMFGSTVTRSWMVWSNGHCPACREGVPMYEWRMSPLELPWKVRCPRCGARFPTNDFAAFYRSGMDESGVFQSARADRSLLVNAEHPEPGDPLRLFGVDDGEGYVADGHRWRFIGAYLVYGQWKGLVLGGIGALADALLVTGDARYARRAGIVLHRVADLYRTHDFELEGLAYEKGHGSGYVSTWHDACSEARALALAYDAVREELLRDGELASWLSGRAATYRGVGSCATPAEVCRHIEDGILRDTLANTKKITSNFPQTDITRLVILEVLGESGEADARGIADEMIGKATAVDGVTGEKGMAAYTAGAVHGMAEYLALGERAREGFLADMLARHPRLADMFRFHVDTLCIDAYYPNSGDSSHFAERSPGYAGVSLERSVDTRPSLWTFLHRLAGVTGDAAYVQLAYRANGSVTDGLPWDLFERDPDAVRRSVAETVQREGGSVRLGCVRKDAWRIGILRSGRGEHARAAWVTSLVGGNHMHFDGMHLGLYARGLDLLPDFGYPPVNYGGWGSPQALWYRSAASHNTVVVDGREQERASATTTLWATGSTVAAMGFSGPGIAGVERYERTVILVEVSEESFYLVDLFRVTGGREHCYSLHSSFGSAREHGAALEGVDGAAVPEWLRALPLRSFRRSLRPPAGWCAEFDVQDRFGYLPAGTQTRWRCTCLTPDTEAWLAEAWISVGGYRNEEAWIPRLMERRLSRGGEELDSRFVNLIEAYGSSPAVRAARSLPGAGACALEIALSDGRRDLLLAGPRDAEEASTDARLAFARLEGGRLVDHALVEGSFLRAPGFELRFPTPPRAAGGLRDPPRPV